MLVQSESADNSKHNCAVCPDVTIGMIVGQQSQVAGVMSMFHVHGYKLGLSRIQLFVTAMLPIGSPTDWCHAAQQEPHPYNVRWGW